MGTGLDFRKPQQLDRAILYLTKWAEPLEMLVHWGKRMKAKL